MKFSEGLLAPYSVAMFYGADTPVGTLDSLVPKWLSTYITTLQEKF